MKKIIVLLSVFFSASGLLSQWVNQVSPTTNFLNSVKCVNANTAYIAGNYETILKTTNSGNNWFIQNEAASGYPLYSLDFINENTGFFVGGSSGTNYYGIIYKTTNGGNNWQINSYGNICFRGITFLNATTGLIAGWSRINKPLLRTTDGGNNWVELSVLNLTGLEKFYFLNQQTGWAVGDAPGGEVVIKTTNAGINWIPLGSANAGTWYSSVFFVNENVGWITGNQSNPWWGLLRKTTNGGINWEQQYSLNRNELYQTYFINENTGWIVGDGVGSSPIQKTTNGGLNWFKQNNNDAYWINGLSFLNQNTGWVVGIGGNILKTVNGGSFSVSGQVRYADNSLPATGGYVKAIKLDKATGSIITYDSVQIQADGNYTLANVPQDSVDIGVYPNSSTQNDWVMTYYPSTIYWQNAVTLYPTGNLTNINIGVFRLFAVTANNSVNGKVRSLIPSGNLKDAMLYAKIGNSFVRSTTSDAGGIYHLVSLPTGTMKIIVNRMGYSGDSTNVTLTPTSNIDSVNFVLSRITIGIRKIENTVPTEYKLFQNYPNPFNPATNIRYQISDNKYVSLKVYDILGKEVVTLVNEKQSPGVYEVTFDAGSQPSGIYFYKLAAGDFSEVKKMVLIK